MALVLEVKQENFIELFESVRKRTATQEDAYEICEEVHQMVCNSRKYSGFQSFYSVFYRSTKKELSK